MSNGRVSIKKRLDLQKFLSPANDKKTPIYRWYLYKHGYSRKVVFEILNILGIKKDQAVLDPFCGGGTTLLASSEKGINSVGYDIMPFAVFVTNTKRYQPKVEEVEKVEKKFTDSLLSVKNGKTRFDVETIYKAFTPTVLSFLVTLRHRIEEIDNSRVRNLFLLAFLRTADFASRAKKDGGFLRITDDGVTDKHKVFDYFKKTLGEMKTDISMPGIRFSGNSSAHLGDSRSFKDNGAYDAVISSPPYPNRHDYTRVYLLEEVLGFGDNDSKIKKLRYNTLRSHVEAKKRFEANGYNPPDELMTILQKLQARELNNSMVVEMLDGYFEDMYLTLKNIKAKLKKGGRVAFVISNARYGGQSIPTDTLLLKVGKQAGLSPKGLFVLRYRGNSSQQTAVYKRQLSRESIVLWENC